MPRFAGKDVVVELAGQVGAAEADGIGQYLARLVRVEAGAIERRHLVVVDRELVHAERALLAAVVVAAHQVLEFARLESEVLAHRVSGRCALVDRVEHVSELRGIHGAVGPPCMVQEAHDAPGQGVHVGQVVSLPVEAEALGQDVLQGELGLLDHERQQRARSPANGDNTRRVHVQGGKVRRQPFLVPDRQVHGGAAAQEIVRVLVEGDRVKVAAVAVRSERQEAPVEGRAHEPRYAGRLVHEGEVACTLEDEDSQRGRMVGRKAGQQRGGRCAEPVQRVEQLGRAAEIQVRDEVEVLGLGPAPLVVLDRRVGGHDHEGKGCCEHNASIRGRPRPHSFVDPLRRAQHGGASRGRWRCSRSHVPGASRGRRGCGRRTRPVGAARP